MKQPKFHGPAADPYGGRILSLYALNLAALIFAAVSLVTALTGGGPL